MYSNNKISSSPFDSSSKKKRKHCDRFIPHSVSKNLYSLFEEAAKPQDKKQTYSCLLSEQLLPQQSGKILTFGEEQNNKENIENNTIQLPKQKIKRIPLKTQPYKILEAPMLKDDFYLNLVDCSDTNHIGVGLQNSLFIWSGCSSKVEKIHESYDYICSVNFMKHNPKIVTGFTDGCVRIFDIFKSHNSVQFDDLHYGRIGSLGCTNNIIATGGRDGMVAVLDHRMEKEIIRYKAHNQEICGLKISPDGQMIATGGNDNKLYLFSLKMMGKLAAWGDHDAAVKAIGFNPKDSSIASGGGTADRKLRIFSLQTLQMTNCIDTGSQICNLLYSEVSNQLVTTHGYSLNQIILWEWKSDGSLKKLDSIMGHKNRVLYLAGQKQGTKIVTGAGDEQLRLWKIFNSQKNHIPFDLR